MNIRNAIEQNIVKIEKKRYSETNEKSRLRSSGDYIFLKYNRY